MNTDYSKQKEIALINCANELNQILLKTDLIFRVYFKAYKVKKGSSVIVKNNALSVKNHEKLGAFLVGSFTIHKV